MPDSNQMQTLSQVLNKLVAKGLKEFILTEKGMTVNNNDYYDAEDLEIVKVFRFEGVSDPSDMSVVYVLQTKDQLLGYSMNAYGTYNDKEIDYDNFIRRVPTRDRDEEISFEL
jgi:hypothetical protein